MTQEVTTYEKLKAATDIFKNFDKKKKKKSRDRVLWCSQEKGTYVKKKHGELK